MVKILLENLQCIKKQDRIGADSCRLEVITDSVAQSPLNQKMTNGQTWQVDQEFAFQATVRVRLWEEDLIGKDSLIGEYFIGTQAANHLTATLNGSNAKYLLQYSVTLDTASEVDEVLQAIEQFEASTQPGVWTYIQKADLIADIRATVANPFQVNQGMTPLCGPASIIYELAAKFPHKYVKACQSLYETGQFLGRTKNIQPSATLRESRVRSDITLADWLLMATLRDTENIIFPVQQDSSVFIMGFTKPWEMAGWTKELLNYEHVENDSLIFFGKCEAMRKAQEVVDRGGVVFMMVQSAMIGANKPPFPYPDHWITFLGNLSIDDSIWERKGGHIQYDCYSWGQRIHVDIDEKSFEDYTWGMVYGSP